jgi:hypothetical protein
MTESAEPSSLRLRSLEEAASGLLFPSETDAPLVPIELSGATELSPEELLRVEKRAEGTKVEQTTIDELFAPLLEAGDDDAKRFGRVVEILKAELTDLRVYRVGSTDIDVYVLGKHSTGAWMGLKTKVVET